MADNGIEFEIKGATTSAVLSIEKLQDSLSKLKTSISGGLGLASAAKELRKFADATSKINFDGFKAVGQAASGLAKLTKEVTDFNNVSAAIDQALSSIEKVAKIDLSNLTAQLDKLDTKKFVELSNGMVGMAVLSQNAQSLPSVVEFLERISNIDFSNLQEAGDALRYLAEATRNIGAIGAKPVKDIGTASRTTSLRMGDFGKKLSAAFKSAAADAKRLAGNFAEVGKRVISMPFKKMAKNVRYYTDRISKLGSSFKRVLFYRAVRTLIKQIGEAFKTGVNNMYTWSQGIGGTFAANMDRMATSMQYFKNSVGAAAAPLLNALAPALDVIIDRAVAALNVINQLFARLTGASYWTRATKQATSYGDAVAGAGGAAKEAMKYLAPFDELNVLPDNNSGGGGGGGGGADTGGMFEELVEFNEEIADFADKLKDAIKRADWEGVGELLGGKVNDIVDEIPWKELGEKFGVGVNAIISTKYWTLDTIHFETIGASLAEFLNGTIDKMLEVDPKTGLNAFDTWGRSITQKLTVALDTALGFLFGDGEKTGLDTEKVGTALHDFFVGVFDSATEWLKDNDFVEIGQTLKTKIENLFKGIETGDIANSFFTALGTSLKSSADFLNGYFGGEDGVITKIKNWFEENVKGKTWTEAANNILNAIGQGFSNISSWVDEHIITPLAQGLGAEREWASAKEMGENIWDNVKNGFNIAGATLNATFSDIMIDWSSDLTGEQIAEKIIAGLSILAGGVIGFAIGGPLGAVVGTLAGIGLSLIIDSIVFDHDGSLNGNELLATVIPVLAGIAGGLIGFSVGGVGGAVLGASIGIGLGLLIDGITFSAVSEEDRSSVLASIVAVLGAAVGGIIGFEIGGIGGALLGATIGLSATLVLESLAFEQAENGKKLWDGYYSPIDWFMSSVLGLPSDAEMSAAIKNKISSLFESINQFFFDLDDRISDWATNTKLATALNELPSKLENGWTLIKAWFSDNFVRGIQQFGIDAANGLVTKIQEGLNRVIDAINTFIENHPKIAEWLGIDHIDPIEFKLIPNLDPPVGTFYEQTKSEIEEKSKNSPTRLTINANMNNVDATLSSYNTPLQVQPPEWSNTTISFNARAELIGVDKDKLTETDKTITTTAQYELATTTYDFDKRFRTFSVYANYVSADARNLTTENKTIGTIAQYTSSDGSKLGSSWRQVDSVASYTSSDGGRLGDTWRTLWTIAQYTKSDGSQLSSNARLVTSTAYLTKVDKSSLGTVYINATANVTTWTNQVKAKGGVYSGGVWHDITAYASGGSPRGGQLFLAREAGPELVGTLRGHTAVMNNNQIVASVSAGVARAISSIQFHMTGFSSASNVPTFDQGEDIEEKMYRAVMRALSDSDFAFEDDINIDMDGESIYQGVVRRNKRNTSMTGVNAMA